MSGQIHLTIRSALGVARWVNDSASGLASLMLTCRLWQHSRVYVSESHPLVEDPIIAKRLSAEIITLRECTLSQSPHAVANVLLFAAVPRAIDMLNAALPLVDKFVDDTIEKRRLAVAKDKARMEEERKAAEGPVLPSRIVPTRWYMDSVEI